ncbi:MAG: LysE family translocator [Campylobacteraceae bacterium]|nr:LysE family translocator [Campylobacteraceae bacterium]
MSAIFAMAVFSLVMSISPGPVNMIIISSGLNNGFKRTISFVSGATIGFTLLLCFIGFGFIKIIDVFPDLFKYLTIIGSTFIMYLGYKIASSRSEVVVDKSAKKPPRFYEGFLLQWLNPKAWLACVSGVSMFSSSLSDLSLFIGIYFLICYMSLSFWAIIGDKINIFFNTQFKLKVFNIIMGGLLIIIALFLVINNI